MPVKQEIGTSSIPPSTSSHSLQELAISKDLLHPDSALPESQKG